MSVKNRKIKFRKWQTNCIVVFRVNSAYYATLSLNNDNINNVFDF